MTKEIQELTKKIEENATADLYYERAFLYHEQKCYQEALDDCNKAIEIDPEYAAPYNGRGNTYRDLKQYDKALADYNKAIELDPEYANPYNGRGNTYHELEQYDKALADYNKANELEPDYPYPYYNRAELLYSLGKHEYENALKDYEKANVLFESVNDYFYGRSSDRIKELKDALEREIVEKSEKDIAERILDVTSDMVKEIDESKKSMKKFTDSNVKVDSVDTLTLTVLRKWNSYTPIVSSKIRSSKGGGYFIQSKNKGIVVDPGFNFIENFISKGYKFKQIDAVFITHAHNDHTSDLDPLLTLLHRYNTDLYGGNLSDPFAERYEEGSILDGLLEKNKYSPEMVRKNSSIMKAIEDEAAEIFKGTAKVITFYMTSGTFKKYAGFFNLMKNSNYKVVCVDCDEANDFTIGDVTVSVIQAKHHDIISDYSSVGFCFEQGDFVLIYTGDTGFGEMANEYKKLMEKEGKDKVKYKDKRIALIANLGGFDKCEKGYSTEKNEDEKKKSYYKNHLGRLGVAKIAEILKPEICIISEFGEEFDGYRIEIAKIYNKVFKEKAIEEGKKQTTVFLPADIGLRINRDMKVEAITGYKSKSEFDYGFIKPENVSIGEVEQISELYYYDDKKCDEVALAKRKVAEFFESLK